MRRTLLVATLTSVALLILAAPATAHTRLVATEPEAGAAVEGELHAVVLHFNQAVNQTIAEVQVLAPDGTAVEEGPVVINQARVEQAVASLPATGDYTVAWRVVASDVHPLTGEFGFTYEGPITAAEPPAAEEPDELEADEEGPEAPAHQEPTAPPPAEDEEPSPAPRQVPEPNAEGQQDTAAAASAPRNPTPPPGLLTVTAAVLLAALASSAYAIRGLARWQPPA